MEIGLHLQSFDFEMRPHIQALFTDDILQEVLSRFAIEPAKIRPLDGFESFIYEFEREGKSYILRVSYSERRSEAMIAAEVEWMNYLAAHGAGVARAALSANDKLVEAVSDRQGGYFLATAFVKAAGGPPRKALWNEGLYERWGRLMGKMHHLSKTFGPAGAKRPNWDDPIFLDVTDTVPASEPIARQKLGQIIAHARQLPQDKESYGLIHYDFHAGNFFVDEQGQITLFDFDDSAYSWFINDIAIVLFYVLTNVPDAPKLAGEFWPPFLRGYRQENELAPAWFAEIHTFLKLREIDLFGIILQQVDLEEAGAESWVGRFMNGRKELIENDVPYVDFDFRGF